MSKLKKPSTASILLCETVVETIDKHGTISTTVCDGKYHNVTIVCKYYNSTWMKKLPRLCPTYLETGKKTGVTKNHLFLESGDSYCGRSSRERQSMARRIGEFCTSCRNKQ